MKREEKETFVVFNKETEKAVDYFDNVDDAIERASLLEKAGKILPGIVRFVTSLLSPK